MARTRKKDQPALAIVAEESAAEQPSFTAAVAAAAPMHSSGSAENAHIVVFRSGDGFFGIDIGIVQEIVLMQDITPVPGSGPYIAGMTDLRGRVIPVAAFSTLLGREPSERTDDTRILVVENGSGHIGLIVDSVTEVMMVDGGRIEDASAIGSRDHDFIVAVAKLDEHLVSLVDVPRLLASADASAGMAVAA